MQYKHNMEHILVKVRAQHWLRKWLQHIHPIQLHKSSQSQHNNNNKTHHHLAARIMFGAKLRGGCGSTSNCRSGLGGNSDAECDETIRRITREKFTVRGNTAYRTLDSTTSFLPIADRWDTKKYIPTAPKLFTPSLRFGEPVFEAGGGVGGLWMFLFLLCWL